jgi:hypothetical protein
MEAGVIVVLFHVPGELGGNHHADPALAVGHPNSDHYPPRASGAVIESEKQPSIGTCANAPRK